jgi:DUF177 domain-containing protein
LNGFYDKGLAMLLEIESIEESGRKLHHSYQVGELVLEDERVSASSPVEIDGFARRKNQNVLIAGTVSGHVQVDCDRCLKKVELPVSAAFDVEFAPQPEGLTGGHELQNEDLNISFYRGDAIDLDQLTGEQVLLAVPVRVLCNENCRGLCPRCGADKNLVQDCGCERDEIDPRWAALKDLK